MAKRTIYIKCYRCSGTGNEMVNTALEGGGSEMQEVECSRCSGDGKMEHALLAASLINMIEDIQTTVDEIKAKVDIL